MIRAPRLTRKPSATVLNQVFRASRDNFRDNNRDSQIPRKSRFSRSRRAPGVTRSILSTCCLHGLRLILLGSVDPSTSQDGSTPTDPRSFIPGLDLVPGADVILMRKELWP